MTSGYQGRAPGQASQRLADLAAIDWQRPWLADWSAIGEPAARHALASGDVAGALNAAGRAPVRFIPQADLPEGVAYEAHIHAPVAYRRATACTTFSMGLCWDVLSADQAPPSPTAHRDG